VLVKSLGKGGQGDVHEAVDINSGEHYACKVVAFEKPIPQWNIRDESEFKRRVRDEVDVVEKAKHVSSPRLPAPWLASR
jgi:serine/threonine protein kinase